MSSFIITIKPYCRDFRDCLTCDKCHPHPLANPKPITEVGDSGGTVWETTPGAAAEMFSEEGEEE